MSTSGETNSPAHDQSAAGGFNERNPDGGSPKGETEQKITPPLEARLWSEFSEDEWDDFDSAGAREQLKKVCMATVGVKMSDLEPTPTRSTLQRSKTMNREPYTKSWSGERCQRQTHLGNTMIQRAGRRQQDNLAIWQEAAAASKCKLSSSPFPMHRSVSSVAAGPLKSSNSPSVNRKRFGGLSFEMLVSQDRNTVSKNPTCSIPPPCDNGVPRKVSSTSEENNVTKASNAVAAASPNVGVSIERLDSEKPDFVALDSIREPMSSSSYEHPFRGNESQDKTLTRTSRHHIICTDTVVNADHNKHTSNPSVRATSKKAFPRTAAPIDAVAVHCPSATEIKPPEKSPTDQASSACSSALSSDDEGFESRVRPRLTEIEGDVLFEQTFDIWFTQPLDGARKGLAKEVYENGMHLIGSFNSLSQFFEFHGLLEWDDLPSSSVIAFCRLGIKPIWEDPKNENGGRFLVKHFKRDETESVFTKIALGFFSGMLHDWKNYNLVSLHIRESRRGNDIQLWRCANNTKRLTKQTVKTDLQDFVENSQPQMTLSFVPNRESLYRNDSRIHQAGRKCTKAIKADRGKGRHSSKKAIDDKSVAPCSDHPVFRLYLQKNTGRGLLGEDQKAAFAKEAEASLLGAVPINAAPSKNNSVAGESPTSCDENGSFPSSEDDLVACNDANKIGDERASCNLRNTPTKLHQIVGKESSFTMQQVCDMSSFDDPERQHLTPAQIQSMHPYPNTLLGNAASDSFYPATYGCTTYHMSGKAFQSQYMQLEGATDAYRQSTGLPSDTFGVTPYPYPPHSYISKGTTYFPMVAVAKSYPIKSDELSVVPTA